MDEEESNLNAEYEAALDASKNNNFILKLYVAGSTSRSLAAITNIRNFCEDHLQNRYRLEVIDIYQQPASARENQVVAAPTLVKLLPPPLRRMIGDFSNEERILVGLDLTSDKTDKPSS